MIGLRKERGIRETKRARGKGGGGGGTASGGGGGAAGVDQI